MRARIFVEEAPSPPPELEKIISGNFLLRHHHNRREREEKSSRNFSPSPSTRRQNKSLPTRYHYGRGESSDGGLRWKASFFWEEVKKFLLRWFPRSFIISGADAAVHWRLLLCGPKMKCGGSRLQYPWEKEREGIRE